MKRKLVVLVLVALAALLAATPALAAGPGWGRQQQHRHGNQQAQPSVQQQFSLVGVITALDDSAITINVYHGNRIVQPYIGQELTVKLTDTTRYRQWTSGGCVPISLDDLEVYDKTSIQGTMSNGIFTAQRVTVDVPCCTP